jgi:hypothetical protein
MTAVGECSLSKWGKITVVVVFDVPIALGANTTIYLEVKIANDRNLIQKSYMLLEFVVVIQEMLLISFDFVESLYDIFVTWIEQLQVSMGEWKR